jgi:hypothetical protein
VRSHHLFRALWLVALLALLVDARLLFISARAEQEGDPINWSTRSFNVAHLMAEPSDVAVRVGENIAIRDPSVKVQMLPMSLNGKNRSGVDLLRRVQPRSLRGNEQPLTRMSNYIAVRPIVWIREIARYHTIQHGFIHPRICPLGGRSTTIPPLCEELHFNQSIRMGVGDGIRDKAIFIYKSAREIFTVEQLSIHCSSLIISSPKYRNGGNGDYGGEDILAGPAFSKSLPTGHFVLSVLLVVLSFIVCFVGIVLLSSESGSALVGMRLLAVSALLIWLTLNFIFFGNFSGSGEPIFGVASMSLRRLADLRFIAR